MHHIPNLSARQHMCNTFNLLSVIFSELQPPYLSAVSPGTVRKEPGLSLLIG